MNWMTSGRKRVQRSQKVKELRAKHFARVAADRARAPVSRPARASSSTLNQVQSADVSRLKSRWTQQLPSADKGSTLQRTAAGSVGADHMTAANSNSPPPTVSTLGPGTTPDFQPGTLDLEVTPPFNATAGQQHGSNGVARIPGAAVPAHHNFERPLRHHPLQQQPTGTFRGGGFLLRAEPDDRPPRHALLPLERRQLVFGGAGGEPEHQDFRSSYEEQLIGSECVDIGDGVSNPSGPPVEEEVRYQRGQALPGDSSADAAAAAAAAADSDCANVDRTRTPRVMDQWGRAGHPAAENTMRFFNDGFAVAQDGSPVVDGPLAATPPGTTIATSSAGVAAFPVNDHETNHNTTCNQFGVRESGNSGGLPRFSIDGVLRGGNRSSPPTTPAGLWKQNIPSEYRSNHQYALESRSVSDCGPGFSGQALAKEQVQPRGHLEDGAEVHHRSQGEHNADLEQGRMLDHEEMMNSLPRDAAPPAFDMLARTWGLFGGALDATTPTAFVASSSNNAKGRETSEERATRDTSFRHGKDGKAGAPPLHASVPVRATTHALVRQGDLSPEPNHADAEHPEASESQQSPPPPLTPTSAQDYDRGFEDGGGSPELMMQFFQGPELEEVVITGGQTGAEALEGEHQNNSQPTQDGIPVTVGDAQHTPKQHKASTETLVSPRPADPKIGDNQEEGEQQPRQADLNNLQASKGPKSVAAADDRDVAPIPANGGDAPSEAQHDTMRRLEGGPPKPQIRTVKDNEPGGSGGGGDGGGSVGEKGGNINTVSQDVMPPGDVQLRPGRRSTPNGSQSSAGHEAAPAMPSSSPHKSAAVPSAEVSSSSHGQDRKRARDAGDEEKGQAQRQDHQFKPGSKLPVRNGGDLGVRAARLSGKAGRLQLEVMKASKCGSGAREGGFGDRNARQGRMERDAGSTIVWYQTIVACLTATS
ncbi:unnamed protein product [Ectocarpus fasciculatus]